VIRIDVHPTRETRPTRHAHPTLSPCMALDYTFLTRSTYSNFSRVTDRFGRILLLLRKKNSRLHPQHVGWPICGSPSSFSPTLKQEVVGLTQASVDSRLLGLPGSYLRHVIGTFNTCSWRPTHLFLTNTSGGYNHLRAPPGLRLSNLNINL
jgi:hypothetical protein